MFHMIWDWISELHVARFESALGSDGALDALGTSMWSTMKVTWVVVFLAGFISLSTVSKFYPYCVLKPL